jgi:hypothetical protein
LKVLCTRHAGLGLEMLTGHLSIVRIAPDFFRSQALKIVHATGPLSCAAASTHEWKYLSITGPHAEICPGCGFADSGTRERFRAGCVSFTAEVRPSP